MPDFDDARLFSALREYVQAAQALLEIDPQDEPRRTLDLAEHKSLAGMALRRRLTELGWTPPVRRAADPRAVEPSSGQAPPSTAERDIDV
ncbi:MAG: hypothetical protein QOJ11_2465 [Frankiales bacterium]|nr:hypothetical protein [Frankiales bacterium]